MWITSYDGFWSAYVWMWILWRWIGLAYGFLFDMNKGIMNKMLCGCGLFSGYGLIWYADLLVNMDNGLSINS